MSRKLIITILVVLIVGIIGGTAFLVMNRLRTSTGGDDQLIGTLTESETGSQQIVDPTGDDDGDGLNNADERTWGTDRKNPDTDGDGFLDGDEVKARHNPTIPAPNDLLPENFVPGREINPLDEAQSENTAIDQFFAEDLDLDGPNYNVTDKYKSEYKDNERTPGSLKEFTYREPIVTQLPAPNERAINVVSDNSTATMDAYLRTAGNLGVYTDTESFAQIIKGLLQGNDANDARSLAITARTHQENLIKLVVPESAVPLHRMLLGYSELFIATLDQMSLWEDDPMKSVLAIRQLEENEKKYMPIIKFGLNQLQQANLQQASQ